MELSEVIDAAVPTGADAWTAVGNFVIPAGVKRIKTIKLAVVPDWGTTAGSVRSAPVIRLIGAGIKEQNPHEYLGVFSSHAEVTTGGISMNDLEIVYDVDIPVQEAGNFDVQCNTLDEAVTAGTVKVNVSYDDKAPTKKNQMAQYVDAAGTTTADVFAAVGTITIPKPESGKDPTKITKLVIGVALDQGTSAISLRCVPTIRLSGAGIKGSGNHDHMGPCSYSGEIGTTPSQGIVQDNGTRMIPVDIDINAGGQIVVEQMFDTETPTASTVAVGLIYE